MREGCVRCSEKSADLIRAVLRTEHAPKKRLKEASPEERPTTNRRHDVRHTAAYLGTGNKHCRRKWYLRKSDVKNADGPWLRAMDTTSAMITTRQREQYYERDSR